METTRNIVKRSKTMLQRKSSIPTSKLNYPLKGQFSEQSFIKEETETALLLSVLIRMENNFNSHEHLLDSIDLNTFHTKERVAENRCRFTIHGCSRSWSNKGKQPKEFGWSTNLNGVGSSYNKAENWQTIYSLTIHLYICFLPYI